MKRPERKAEQSLMIRDGIVTIVAKKIAAVGYTIKKTSSNDPSKPRKCHIAKPTLIYLIGQVIHESQIISPLISPN